MIVVVVQGSSLILRDCRPASFWRSFSNFTYLKVSVIEADFVPGAKLTWMKKESKDAAAGGEPPAKSDAIAGPGGVKEEVKTPPPPGPVDIERW